MKMTDRLYYDNAYLWEFSAVVKECRPAREENLSYLTFIEIRNAIEMLGGNCPEREFEEDPEYEALRGMDMT